MWHKSGRSTAKTWHMHTAAQSRNLVTADVLLWLLVITTMDNTLLSSTHTLLVCPCSHFIDALSQVGVAQYSHRIAELLRSEGISTDHLVQPHCSKQGQLQQAAQDSDQLHFLVFARMEAPVPLWATCSSEQSPLQYFFSFLCLSPVFQFVPIASQPFSGYN